MRSATWCAGGARSPANGNYVTKHSFGIYSTTPTAGPWRRQDPNELQAELDRLPKAPHTATPSGAAHMETYTIMHGKAGPEYAIVFGRLDVSDERFIANAPADRAVLEDLQAKEGLGRPGMVHQRDRRNIFVPQ
jgi:acetyl-CoA C-acetyltransferase